ncbi:MAG: NUDIX hydrolase [Limnochordales bacterium]|nr:NUDIX hydrolase [Limnochordales bacterium]
MAESAARRFRLTSRLVLVDGLPANRLLLITARSGAAWVTPGGTVDPGEDPRATAKREAEEETGLPVHVDRLIYVSLLTPEDVVELFFLGLPAAPLGPERWSWNDPDGPRREARWFAPAELQAEPLPVYPQALRHDLWPFLKQPETQTQEERSGRIWPDPYLGIFHL